VYIEMIDLLRCPLEHEETWLVAAFSRMNGRFVMEGKLGCPVCNASYEVTDGIARFAEFTAPREGAAVEHDDAVRTAALLNLTRPGSLAVLCGNDAGVAEQVSAMTQCRVIALNPSSLIDETEYVAVIHALDRFPIGSASVDAVAIGDCDRMLADAARILRPSGRLTAPASSTLPEGFRELARDDVTVVCERVSPLVTIGRNR